MLKIGFIFPSSEYLFDPFRGDPFTHFQILTTLEDRLGDKVDVSLIDPRGVKREFAQYRIPECDIFLHSVYTLDYEEQSSIVKFLRERYPKALHIAGGPHAHSFQQECSEIFDSLILGEGEEMIVKAVNDILDLKLQQVYRQESPIDINAYPYWRRGYLPASSNARKGLMTLKRSVEYDQLLATNVMFSRGCPYSCYFCAMNHIKEYAPGIRYRTPINVEREIEYLQQEYGMGGIILNDEIGIPLNKKEAQAHLEAIGRTGITWRGQCRVDGITPELAKLARQSGCIAMGLGAESVEQKSLDIINKNTDARRVRETIALLKENDIEARVYMIIGLPGESEDVVEQIWSFIQETKPDLVYLSLFTIRPGTEVFNNPEKFGIKKTNSDWGKTMHMYGRYEDEVP